ncbi:MAG TPA: porin [Planctomycetota bacterium]|nr:porin [Planctomycetota bacterium]
MSIPRLIALSTSLALIAGAPCIAAEGGGATLEERLAELDQEVRILKRQSEIAAEEAANKAKTASSTNVNDKGFSWASADKGFSLKIGAYVQTDGRFYLDDDNATPLLADKFLVRRARVVVSGGLGPWIDYRIMPDFAASTILQDAYANAKLAPAAQIQVGLQKAPVGLERLRSGAALTFLERGYPTSLAPNRDVGVQLHGDVGTFGRYEVGVFNGTPDGASVATDVNDDKDGAARLWFTPFAAGDIDLLRGLGFGVGGTLGFANGATPSHTSIGQAVIFTYRAGTTAEGRHTRVHPQLFWSGGPFSLLAEYALSQQEIEVVGADEEVEIDAYQVQASWVLTGEEPTWRGVKPKRPFAVGGDGWGAFELAARVTGIDFGDAHDLALAAATAVREATTYGVALNWHLTGNLKWQIDYEHTEFDGGGALGEPDRDTEQALSTRVQFSF